jgi:hypothetical protein
MIVLYGEEMLYPPNSRADIILGRLPEADYPTCLQMPSIFSASFLHPQLEDGPFRGVKKTM